MKGIEYAILANDACGSPVPWEFCCPWNFFDGKLFHSKWLQSTMKVNTTDLCEGKVCMIFRYRISSNKRPRHLLNFETVRCGANQKEAVISKFGKLTILNVNIIILSFKIRMKQVFFISKPHIILTAIFYCFIVCIQVTNAFWFSFQQKIIRVAFKGAALIRAEALISMWIPKGPAFFGGQRLFEAPHL